MNPYAPCACGSGKKFKFCCRDREREQERVEKEQAGWKPFRNDAILDWLEAEEDRGAKLLDEQRFEEAAVCFESLALEFAEIPELHWSLAHARFQLGQLDAAEASYLKVLRLVDEDASEPLGRLVRIHLLRGRRGEALQCAERLWRSRSVEAEAVWEKVVSCALFRREEKLIELVARWHYPDHEIVPDLAFHAGVAAANLGRTERACEFFATAIESPAFGETADRFLDRIERQIGPNSLSGRWPHFSAVDLIPEALRADLIEGRFPASDGLRDFLIELLEDSDGEDTWSLDALAVIGGEPAREILRAISKGQAGTFGFRIRAACALQRLGEFTLADDLEIWDGSGWCRSPGVALELESGPEPTLPILSETSVPELRKRLEQSLARDPEDMLARAVLARVLFNEEGVPAASALLAGRALPRLAHPAVIAFQCGIEIDLHLASGDLAGAASWLILAQRAAPEWGLSNGFAFEDIEELYELEQPFDVEDWERARIRRSELSNDPPFAHVLGGWRLPWVQRFAAAHAIPLPPGLARTPCIERICAALAERGIESLLAELEDAAICALDTLFLPGSMTLERFEIGCQALGEKAGLKEEDAEIAGQVMVEKLEDRAAIVIALAAEDAEVEEAMQPSGLHVFLTREARAAREPHFAPP